MAHRNNDPDRFREDIARAHTPGQLEAIGASLVHLDADSEGKETIAFLFRERAHAVGLNLDIAEGFIATMQPSVKSQRHLEDLYDGRNGAVIPPSGA